MKKNQGPGWSANLTRTIVLRDGTKLETLADATQFILKEPDYILRNARAFAMPCALTAPREPVARRVPAARLSGCGFP
jgi:hypothetical protein